MKTIFVVYTENNLTAKQIRTKKKYCFNTNSEVKVGEMIKSTSYNTSMLVTDVLDKSYIYYSAATGKLSNELESTAQHKIVKLEILDSNEEEVVYANRVTNA